MMMKPLDNDKEYFAYKALSASQIKTYATGGAYEFWKSSVFNDNRKEQPESDALIFGKLAHCMLFEQNEVENRFLVTNWGTKTRGSKAYEKTKQENPEKIIVSEDEYNRAGLMLASLREHKLAREIITGAYCEVPFVWQDKETGLMMKCKVDAFKKTKRGVVVIDYKTSSDIEGLLNRAEKLQYPLQDICYCEAMAERYGQEPVEFVFIIQSSKEGEEDKICVANVDTDSRLFARDYYKALKFEIADKLKKWRETGDKNIWAAYPERMFFSYSNWYYNKGGERWL